MNKTNNETVIAAKLQQTVRDTYKAARVNEITEINLCVVWIHLGSGVETGHQPSSIDYLYTSTQNY